MSSSPCYEFNERNTETQDAPNPSGGVVDQADLRLTRQANGSRAGDPRYNFNADVNRDGRIGKVDLAYVQQNMGVRVNP